MTKQEPLRLRPCDVPLPVIYEGPKGERVVYELKPAGRKFGLSLQAASKWLKQVVARKPSK